MDSLRDGPRGGADSGVEASEASDSDRRALVVVAHPDDETLWVGGTMLMHPAWSWRVVSLCRGTDPDRRPRFFGAMTRLGGRGDMGDLDDGPEQRPLSGAEVRKAVRWALQDTSYDLIVTHSPFGEYTRHLRHEEVGRAALELWQTGDLSTKELWLFAYSDGGRAHRPMAIEDADLVVSLPEDVWQKKLAIIQEVYDFAPDSWEVRSSPRTEAFWCFDEPGKALAWQRQCGSRTPCEAASRHARKEGQRESAAAV